MKNFKKRLSIEVEDIRDDEEELQTTQVNKETNHLKVFESTMQFENQLKMSEEERYKILELNNTFINQILCYMENENISLDLSYKWYSILFLYSIF
jgi:hypothetical protein